MELPELLLIDKPEGITSFDVIRQLRRATGIRKFGHGGTLDPAASGLMLIGVERGTKRLAELIKLDKTYEATILLGESRTTGDREGEVIAQQAVTEAVSPETVARVLQGMVGELTLPVSAYSAIKRDGVPMYERARKAAKTGEVVTDVPVRTMRVDAAELLGIEEIIVAELPMLLVSVRFAVGSGVYIRSLAEEFGRRLAYPASLRALRRTVVGEYRIEDAVPLGHFTNRQENNPNA